MRHDLLPLPCHGVFPARLGRAVLRDVLVIAATLALAILILLATLAVRSLPARAAEAPPSGLYFLNGSSDSALAAPTLKTDVVMTVNGMVNRVTVRQVFHNPSDRWLEGLYVFPLPERSAVDRLTMEIGDRRVQGRILEKAEAERVYREAAENGQRASLVSGERPNVFVTSLANIGPGEDVTVEIGYQDSVAYESGVFSLRFPMVVAPRYTPAPPAAEVADAPSAPQADPAVVRRVEGEPRDLFGPVDSDETTAHPLSLRVELNAGVPLASLHSLYHPVVIESRDDNRQTITLRDDAVPADRDFVLQWRPVPSATPQAAVFAEQVGGDAHLLVTMLPPAQPQDSAAPAAPLAQRPRDLVFVIDTSGSMYGGSLEQAKAAVIEALKRLKPQDRFNIIRFNDETHALFPRAAAATVGNVAQAWHYVSALEAEGGTEMRPALERALAAPPQEQRPEESFLRQVVFLTDAAVSNEAELFGEVARRLGDSRLFTVGIGSAPNSYFMRKAAELGRGSFTYIGDLSEVKSRIDTLLTRLERPALTDIRVGWPLSAGKRIELYPTPLPDLYVGQPVTFAARLEGVDLARLDGQLLITGRGPEGAWQQRLPLDRLSAAPGVAAIWARAKIAQIEDGLYRADGGVDSAAIRARALGVALQHRLVTRYTSLVAVDEEVARPEGETLETAEIERDLPQGWDAEKVFGAQEALPAPDPTAAPGALQDGTLRSRALPGYLLQQARAAGGQPVSLPQTATPAERMTIVGSAYLFLALALIGLVALRRRRGVARG